MPMALGHTSRLRRSILVPMALDPLWLPAASSEFPDGAHLPTALDPLRLPPGSSKFPSARPRAQVALANSREHL